MKTESSDDIQLCSIDEVVCTCCKRIVDEINARSFSSFVNPEIDNTVHICDDCIRDNLMLADEKIVKWEQD